MENDVGDLDGRVAIVTGANSGVGLSASGLLATAGAHVVMVCRNRERGERALERVRRAARSGLISLEIADLADQSSVRDLAVRLNGRLERVDALINNAGVYRARREISPDGMEVTQATNHLGHFLLTALLVDALRAGDGRVVNVSSDGHRRGDLRRARLEAIMTGDAWSSGIQAYCDSKLSNVLFTFELARRHADDGITANALHPGVLATRIWNQSAHPLSLLMRLFKPFMGRPAVGGRAVFRLAADPGLQDVSGRYFHVENEAKSNPAAHDEELARDLWETSERLTGLASRS